ncbi:hypothetical protein BOTBODRAFT_561882 [Botryobasidium botryosum FD-172 SS1]|uniref:Alpha/beta hydrolase fold-3 domain-containing protein n=1 Tax=Botryobasidium botryosum (strain FD-172 SS1) TaxID=930990 RepID=A0A067M9Q2_BOTB1|nr:hypothetical protein BOTBODRAFT_561882 [Botryobasidium botryosum FD-172 SS1]
MHMALDAYRALLYVHALWWRFLMAIGMYIHRLPHPRPLAPTFTRYIPTTLAAHRGTLRLVFYTPPDYNHPYAPSKQNPSPSPSPNTITSDTDHPENPDANRPKRNPRHPCIINFHGGGFTMGTATDDAHWATAVVRQAGTVVCSVDYRLAPLYPFPTAVEDGADAVLWVHDHAEELGVDPERIGVSGFSAGGNMAISVPLRVQEELSRRRGVELYPLQAQDGDVDGEENGDGEDGEDAARATSDKNKHKLIKLVVAFYPSTDYTRSRASRRATLKHPHTALPRILTHLFDASYLYPPQSVLRDSPYLSPGVAPDALLRLLPDEFVLCTCEFDMLLAEDERFRDRLRELGKRVWYRMVEGVPHGWDKMPNLFGVAPGVEECYREACREIKRVFHGE